MKIYFSFLAAVCLASMNSIAWAGSEGKVTASHCWVQGVMDEAHGNLQLAAVEYRRAVSLAPNDYSMHVTFANFLYRQNCLPEAVKEMRQIVRLRPTLAYWHLRLGNTLNLMGNQVQASKEWHQVILLDDNGGYSDEAKKMLRLTEGHH